VCVLVSDIPSEEVIQLAFAKAMKAWRVRKYDAATGKSEDVEKPSWDPRKKSGVPVEYIVFPDEGHGFTKKKNQIEGYGAILRFLDKHLKNAPVRAAVSGS